LLEEDLFAFAFRFRTFSWRALIPSVGVIVLAELGTAEVGLSGGFELVGMVSFGSLLPALILLGRRPLEDFGSSPSKEFSSGVARSSRSIKSAREGQKMSSQSTIPSNTSLPNPNLLLTNCFCFAIPSGVLKSNSLATSYS
jgi:hypothetical protein